MGSTNASSSLKSAAVPSGNPWLSTARTRNLWAPFPCPVYVTGLRHGVNRAASSQHSHLVARGKIAALLWAEQREDQYKHVVCRAQA